MAESDEEVDLVALLDEPNVEKKTATITHDEFRQLWEDGLVDQADLVRENVDEDAVGVTGASAEMREDGSGIDYEVEYYVIEDEQ